MNSITVTLDESDRQATLLALGHLAVERPGWNYMLGEIAEKLQGREMYEQFRDWHNAELELRKKESGKFITCHIVR